MCGSMLFAGNADRCTPSSAVLRTKHMLGMHKRVVCVQMCGQLTSNMGSGSVFECLTALASAVQHDEANCKRFKVAWNSTLEMPCNGQCPASLQPHNQQGAASNLYLVSHAQRLAGMPAAVKCLAKLCSSIPPACLCREPATKAGRVRAGRAL